MRTTQLSVLLALCMTSLRAEGPFVYTNNSGFPNNSVSAFSIGANGALTPIPGSPFPTGGSVLPVCIACNRITSTILKNSLYVGNDSSNNVSAMPGSPFSTGGNDGLGISLATTPDDKFLIAANASSDTITCVPHEHDAATVGTTGGRCGFAADLRLEELEGDRVISRTCT